MGTKLRRRNTRRNLRLLVKCPCQRMMTRIFRTGNTFSVPGSRLDNFFYWGALCGNNLEGVREVCDCWSTASSVVHNNWFMNSDGVLLKSCSLVSLLPCRLIIIVTSATVKK